MKRNSQRGQCGFTLIELLVSLVLAAIVLAVAVPSMGMVTARYQMRSAALQLHSALETARTEAVIRGEPVELCPRAPEPGKCGVDYRQGWIVRTIIDELPELLRDSGPLPPGFSVSNRLSTYALTNPVFYRADGSTERNLTFQLCAQDAVGADAFAVVLTIAGRSRVARGEGFCPGERA
ncbi:GspH/FimT family pseudopilin [Halioglobus maricola]|uniref:GspH/FimT family pseudopilin n=1 Tax=Halioglobus maricola TaxID=2601894 RepID=UPI0014780C30|nr:GspH/FimT family pseudopilin [Halioglobus maricola]